MKPTVKIDIIAGFLGAGKTTLINKLLAEAYFGEKIAILENEFGAIGVDGSLIERDDINITEMSGGCICCSLKTTLQAGLVEICKSYQPDRIIIEPTGLADTEDIAIPVKVAAEEYPMEIDRTITVINGVNFLALAKAGVPIIGNQLHHTDVAILSRVDQCDKREVIREIHNIEPDLTVISADWSKINGLAILHLADEVGGHHRDSHEDHSHCSCGCDHDHDHEHHHHHHSADDYSFYNAETEKIADQDLMNQIKAALTENKGGHIYRAKGILRREEQGIRFDYVDGEFNTEPHAQPEKGKFVVIGKEVKDDFWKSLLVTE